MANCHKLFDDFHSEIQILKSKKDRLKDSKDALREKIKKHFAEHHPEYEPVFYIQGSYKMGTAIRTKDDTCDLDDGIYFLREPDVSAFTLQCWVRNAVNEHTDEQQHREKCISVIYKKIGVEDFNIDIPVYFLLKGKSPNLATKTNGWHESDPKEMVEWFIGKKKAKSQIVRQIRYLKIWCDFVRNKMPSGLAMTILACNQIGGSMEFKNDRDDITLRNLLKSIRRELKSNWKCVVPAVPNDDLFEKYSNERKENFFKRLDSFIEDADQAVEGKNQLKSSRLWQKHLGDKYFPDGEDKDEDMETNSESGLAGIVGNQKPWYSHDK